jgi:hypothetical protein
MKIETKYSIGETVWVLDMKGLLNGPKTGGVYAETIRSITLNEDGKVVYNNGYGRGYFYADWAFPTKKEALEHA